MASPRFGPGDVVALTSGSPLLRVTDVHATIDGGWAYECDWTSAAGENQRGTFAENSLRAGARGARRED